MDNPRLSEVRLTAFKTFEGEVLPIESVTVITGRNSSGKSNALDAIEVLARLATGDELSEVLDGRRREHGPVRGGSRGCAPHGQQEFALGCTVELGSETWTLDVRIAVEPELRIVSEVLSGPAPALASGVVADRQLVSTRETRSNAAGIEAAVHNGKRGRNLLLTFRDNRLVTSQVALRLAGADAAEQAVIRGAQLVTSTLLGAFHFDPVPQLMRTYVSERDTELRRTGENISAALAHLKTVDEPTFTRLVALVRAVADERIADISIQTTSLGDVTLALDESFSDHQSLTPAREMSDGLLRFIAVATALMTARRGLDIDAGGTVPGTAQGVLVVIEELENGLHPSQAARVLELVQSTVAQEGSQVVLTTHSPALLNVMTGHLNRNVLVCYRSADSGLTRIARMTELPGYALALTGGDLGDAVSTGRLLRPEVADRDVTEFNQLLGIA